QRRREPGTWVLKSPEESPQIHNNGATHQLLSAEVMATTTYVVDRERGARARAVPPVMNPRRQQVVLLLGTLTASFSCSAVLGPPGKLWLDNRRWFTGSPFDVTHPRRYVVFFYCSAIAFVASLVVILLHLLPANLISSNLQRIKCLWRLCSAVCKKHRKSARNCFARRKRSTTS
uniref:PGG domain-containing protein n=1 Tax=Aegilops tauschii subsp. strangulata TaxID=200361 RepID=A0A453MJK6_AEGTS